MLSREIDRMHRGLLARATAIEAGKAGPVILDLAGILAVAEILDGWIDLADAMEQSVVPEKFKTAEVVAFPALQSVRAAAR